MEPTVNMPECTIIPSSTTFTTKNSNKNSTENPGKSTSNQSTVSMKSKRNLKQKSKTTNSDTVLEIITGKTKVNINRKPKSKYYQQKI